MLITIDELTDKDKDNKKLLREIKDLIFNI